MGRLLLAFVIALLACRSVVAQETDASSSCKEPRTQVEYRVCNSPYATLKAIDREIGKWYQRALTASDDREALQLEQQEWIRSLDRCLTSESIEPVSYGCDSIHDPAKKDQCSRDFCLVLRYHERSRVLHRKATAHLPRQYIVSREWPTGIHESMESMQETDRPLCWAVNSRLSRHGPLIGPLLPDSKFKLPRPWPSVASHSIKQPDLISLAQRLEVALRQKWHHPTGPVFNSAFTELLLSRIASGELEISVYPHGSEDSGGRVLRYQRWTRTTSTTPYDFYSPVEFFHSPDKELDSLAPIGTGDDVFVFHEEVFIAKSSERGFDNAWQSLPLPQPVLHLYKIALQPPNKAFAVPVCHFIYSGPL